LECPRGSSRTRSYRSTPCGGIGAAEPRERLLAAETPTRRLDILEQAVTAGFFTILPNRWYRPASRGVGLIRSGRPIDWADLAVTAGYFDQAHFIHDFRAFSGIVPSAYAREDLRHGNHVPIRD